MSSPPHAVCVWRAIPGSVQELTVWWAVLVNQELNTGILWPKTQWKLQHAFVQQRFPSKSGLEYIMPLLKSLCLGYNQQVRNSEWFPTLTWTSQTKTAFYQLRRHCKGQTPCSVECRAVYACLCLMQTGLLRCTFSGLAHKSIADCSLFKCSSSHPH